MIFATKLTFIFLHIFSSISFLLNVLSAPLTLKLLALHLTFLDRRKNLNILIILLFLYHLNFENVLLLFLVNLYFPLYLQSVFQGIGFFYNIYLYHLF